MRNYNLFISHSWAYTEAYEKLVNFLDAAPNFSYSNYSVPKNDPIHYASSDRQLREALKRQIAPTSCILIPAGVYATYSKWINIEIDLAQNAFSSPKKIIAIEPWDSDRTSTLVKNAADKIVRWNTSSIVSAIREVCCD